MTLSDFALDPRETPGRIVLPDGAVHRDHQLQHAKDMRRYDEDKLAEAKHRLQQMIG